MATGSIPAGVRPISEGGTGASNGADARENLRVPQLIKFTNMAGLSASDLLDALNANNSSIPLGVTILQLGSSGNSQIACVLCIKNSTVLGRGIVVSSYSINGLTVTLGNAGWVRS